MSLGLTLGSCHYASGVGQVQEDRREGWVQEVQVVKTRRLSSWDVILARVTEKESTGDFTSPTHDTVGDRRAEPRASVSPTRDPNYRNM